MQIHRKLDMLHPALAECTRIIQRDVINAHNIPMRLFETGREHDRHHSLIMKGKTKDVMSRHLFDLDNDPPLYATAVDYVYFGTEWSWNLRNAVILQWYALFGQMVLARCPELSWGGLNRKCTNYNHFFLRREAIVESIDETPCVVP